MKTKLDNDDDRCFYKPAEDVICLDELQQTITTTQDFNSEAAAAAARAAIHKHEEIQVDPMIVQLLKEYVAGIATAYRNNPFHNFSHACHVTMSVHKLLKRIKNGNDGDEEDDDLAYNAREQASSNSFIHDPMALFAIAFSALIHDVDHQGVSNQQLGTENPEMANHYRQKSIAEQNSVDVAWVSL